MHNFFLFIFTAFKIPKHKFISKSIDLSILKIKTEDKYKIVASNAMQIKFLHFLLHTYYVFRKDHNKNDVNFSSAVNEFIAQNRNYNLNENFKSLLNFYYKDMEKITDMTLDLIGLYFSKNRFLNKLIRNISYDIFLIIFIRNYTQQDNILFFKQNYNILKKLKRERNYKDFFLTLHKEMDAALAGGYALLTFDEYYNRSLANLSQEEHEKSLSKEPYTLFFIYKKMKNRKYSFHSGYFLYLENKQDYLKKYDNNFLRHLKINQENQLFNYDVSVDDSIFYSELIKK